MAGDRLTEIPVVFYRTAAGAEPVREWLQELVDRESQDDRDRPRDPAGRMADWYAAVPIARIRAVGGTQQARKQQDRTPGLFRGGGANWGTPRVIKDTRKTPPTEIALAQKRMKEMMK